MLTITSDPARPTMRTYKYRARRESKFGFSVFEFGFASLWFCSGRLNFSKIVQSSAVFGNHLTLTFYRRFFARSKHTEIATESTTYVSKVFALSRFSCRFLQSVSKTSNFWASDRCIVCRKFRLLLFYVGLHLKAGRDKITENKWTRKTCKVDSSPSGRTIVFVSKMGHNLHNLITKTVFIRMSFSCIIL